MAFFYLRRSFYTHYGERRFRNIIESFAYIGGLISIMMTIGSVVMNNYNESSFIKTIA